MREEARLPLSLFRLMILALLLPYHPLGLSFLSPLIRRRPNIADIGILEVALADTRLGSILKSVLRVRTHVAEREALKFLHDLPELELLSRALVVDHE